ncbi:Transposable element Tc1 transposase-like 3, partial [Homarus americanus]
ARILRTAEDNPFTNAVAIHRYTRNTVLPDTLSLVDTLTSRWNSGTELSSQTKRPLHQPITAECTGGRGNNTRYDRKQIYEEARRGRSTCNVWGYMSVHGVGDLVQIDGSFTEMKKENSPSPPGPIVFVHDRCPIHTARVVQQWFPDSENLQLPDWPSRGADMNPLENLWANILFTHTEAEWEVFRAKYDILRNLVRSMPERLNAVINKEGEWTGYSSKEFTSVNEAISRSPVPNANKPRQSVITGLANETGLRGGVKEQQTITPTVGFLAGPVNTFCRELCVCCGSPALSCVCAVGVVP